MTTLGKYELLEELGRGGFGTVYRAHDTTLDVERAIKILHPSFTASPEFIERFRREGRFAARLEHPHIVPVYELGETEGSYYLVMKYLAGGSLKDLLGKNGPLPFVEAVEITRQVADALMYAYQQPEKLIHRDLKPGNILFERLPGGGTKAVVRLSDFGFAKALAEASTNSSSSSGGMLGTPSYMAPEVWHGKAASPAMDQYALACALYEMLTGNTLFTGGTPPEIMTKHVLYGPELSAVWPEGVPAGFGTVLRRALATNPNDRYPTTEEFSTACLQLLTQPVISVSPESKITPTPVNIKPETKLTIETPPISPPVGPLNIETKQSEPQYTISEEQPKGDKTQSPQIHSGRPVEQPRSSKNNSNIPGWAWGISGLLVIVCCLTFGASSLAALFGRGTATAIPTEIPTKVVVKQPPSPTATHEIPPTTVPTDTPTSEPEIVDAVPAGDKATIHWFVGLGTGTDPSQIAVEEEVVNDFNASQNRITLMLEVVPFASAKDALSTEMAADNGPDIVGPVGWGGANAYEGQWANLTPLIKQANFDTGIFNSALVKFYQVGDKQVGLPFAVFPGAMYFVPSMFDKAGLAYPPQKYGEQYNLDGVLVNWDWDTVTEVARRLTLDRNGKNATQDGFDKSQIVQVGYNSQWQSPLSIATFYAGAAKIYTGDRTGNYKSAIPDSWKNAWRWYYNGMWGNQPFIPTGALAGSAEFGAGNVFNSGKAAMSLTQTWYTCCLSDFAKAGNKFQLGIQPMGSDGKVHGRIDADTFRMWKGSKNPNAAFTVMAYLITTGADKLLPAYGAMPAIASKTDAFFANKSADYPFVTQKSWNVFIQGLSYPDAPSAEQFQPYWNEASAREQTFLDLMNNTQPSFFDFDAEFQKLVDDLNTIYNK